MKLKNLLKVICFNVWCLLPLSLYGANDREIWIDHLTEIVDPLLINLNNGTLKSNMPMEMTSDGLKRSREKVTHLEAFGRTICGIAPWLELGADGSKEGLLREKYIEMTLVGLKNIVDTVSPDFLNFTVADQNLVDAAFLAEGLMRAPRQLWENSDEKTKSLLIKSFKSTRCFKPHENNWLLFSAMIEAFLYRFTGECDFETIDNALDRFEEWYKGDGWYGDGPVFHFDYYNSLVIHPMLYDILLTVRHVSPRYEEWFTVHKARLVRYAGELERLISPEGTYPLIGRSSTYRFGIFHALSQVVLLKTLPENLPGSQVRSALSKVITKQINQKGTFDKNGWLTLGFCGHQPDLAESYISTGSLYLCTAVFLPLGLKPTDDFWTEPAKDWTNKKAWNGQNLKADKAIKH